MASDPWPALAERPWAHDYCLTLRRLEALHRDKPRLGTARRPVDEPVRLGQAPELTFAPSALHFATPADAYGKPRIEVRFFGLFGPNGPLPLHLTEVARERLLHRADATFARFADMFHHRLLLLFYRAWAQAQPVASLDRPDDDRFGAMVGALAGLGAAELRRRDAAPDHAKLFFAGLFARQARSAEGLEALLGGYLQRPVRVECFAGGWLELPVAERTQVGRRRGVRDVGAALGAGAVLGRTVWDRQHHVDVHAGPLPLHEFESLLPGGEKLPALASLVKLYVGDEFAWSLKLRLKADEVPTSRPGKAGRLGWTSWLASAAPRRRDAEITLAPEARAAEGALHP